MEGSHGGGAKRITPNGQRSAAKRSITRLNAGQVLIYCRDYSCNHHVVLSADGWADDVRLSDIEPKFNCTGCGQRGDDVRPNFEPAKMGTG